MYFSWKTMAAAGVFGILAGLAYAKATKNDSLLVAIIVFAITGIATYVGGVQLDKHVFKAAIPAPPVPA